MADGTVLSKLTIVMVIFLVTANTAQGRTLENVVHMTHSAQHSRMCTGQFESCQVVVKNSPAPGFGCMASRTILAQCSVVHIILLMAGKAIGWRAFEDFVDVTFCAEHTRMCPRQLKSRQIMIKRGPTPGLGGMTTSAILAQAAIMLIIFLVTSKTIGWRAFKDIVDVTGFAQHIDMLASQFESRKIMVKSGLPGSRGMAKNTIRTQAALMSIIFLVTGYTIGRRALKHIINMASLA